jgi:hypothetical protein
LLLGRRNRVQMPAQAGKQLAEGSYRHQDDAGVVFASLDEAQVEAGIVGEVVGNQGPPLSGGKAKVLLVWESLVSFR